MANVQAISDPSCSFDPGDYVSFSGDGFSFDATYFDNQLEITFRHGVHEQCVKIRQEHARRYLSRALPQDVISMITSRICSEATVIRNHMKRFTEDCTPQKTTAYVAVDEDTFIVDQEGNLVPWKRLPFCRIDEIVATPFEGRMYAVTIWVFSARPPHPISVKKRPRIK